MRFNLFRSGVAHYNLNQPFKWFRLINHILTYTYSISTLSSHLLLLISFYQHCLIVMYNVIFFITLTSLFAPFLGCTLIVTNGLHLNLSSYQFNGCFIATQFFYFPVILRIHASFCDLI